MMNFMKCSSSALSVLLLILLMVSMNFYTVYGNNMNVMSNYNICVNAGKTSGLLKPCTRDDIFVSLTNQTIKQEAIHFCQYLDLDQSSVKYEELISLLNSIPKFVHSNLTIRLEKNSVCNKLQLCFLPLSLCIYM